MKSIAFFFCFLAAARLSVLCAPIQSQHASVVARKNAGGSGPSYLVNEGFEGAGAPSGWSAEKNTPLWDYTTDPLVGAESLMLNGKVIGDDVRANFTFTEQTGTTYLFFRMKVKDADLTGTMLLATVQKSATLISSISITNGSIRVQSSGGTLADTVSTISVGNTYDFFISVSKGTGSDCTTTVGFVAATGARPTSGAAFAQCINGTSTNGASKILLYGEYLSGSLRADLIFDRVLVASSQISDNP